MSQLNISKPTEEPVVRFGYRICALKIILVLSHGFPTHLENYRGNMLPYSSFLIPPSQAFTVHLPLIPLPVSYFSLLLQTIPILI